jgi:hypothetical protein
MSIKTLVIAASFVLSASGVAVAETPSAGFSTAEAPTTYTAMKKHTRKPMRRSAGSMSGARKPTGGHNSGGGTSSGGMSR